ncbi:MAG TPA: hypothetical protein VJV78_01015 [Polyangiales bacterium]|nr:hypothetical protein [Polyangiales bacterium]
MAAGGCAEALFADSAVCDAHVTHSEVAVLYYDRVDVLFVLDDSPSMAQEREHFLEQQLPRATSLLLRGQTPDRKLIMRPPQNVHVGVVSADMGVGADGIVSGCSASGDDGLLLNAAKCQASEPAFSWYYQGFHDLDATEAAIQCLGDVGSAGCRVSQPLEAALKALWPAGSASSVTDMPVPSTDYTFRGDSQGHGLDANARFLRSRGALSLVVVIIVTDQDDCSTHDPTTFTAGANAGLGCLANPDKLRAVQTYVSGLRALRPDDEQLLMFGIIAGVPPEYVETVLEPARRGFEHAMLLRSAFDGLLSDPRMQPDTDNVMPSCSSATATATAPRRLMQFARDLGRGTYVQSICDYDLARMFSDMLDVEGVKNREAGICSRIPLVPDSQGLLPCRITWELPKDADPEEPLTPVSCADRPELLSDPGPGFPQRSERGRVLCEVRQAPVRLGADGSITPQGVGFFGAPKKSYCPGAGSLKIGFSPVEMPPSGVTVAMECVDETQRVGAKLRGVPAIGDTCLQWETLQGSDALCGNASGDHGSGKLFCHPQSNRCVLGCSAARECPSAWACDAASGSCIKPACEQRLD